MGDQAPKMGKKFFGYDRASVERMLLERDAMLKVAERRVQTAESKAAKMEERIQALEDRAKQAEAIAEATATAARTAPPHELAEVLNVPRGVSAEQAPEDLAKAVTAAEASASQIIQAWMSTREQIAQADKLWRSVQEEVVQFAAWRDDVQPLMDEVQSCIEEARARIEEVPGRVQHALAPAVDAMVTASDGMSRFAAVSVLPLLPSPPRAETSWTDDDGEGPAEEVPPAAHFAEGDGEGGTRVDEDSMAHAPSDEAAEGWHAEEPASEAAQADRLTEATVVHGDSRFDYFDN
jgi:hypothetical protein